ncbi:efflux RND transporter permease subunit [Leptospira congkakensis]|uniref:Efflux RND transporter permease subunit n=1 Tax=Leptospira congkakensis TaxID=2484932 RepID=A0A4Z1A920_9LEPT|nr:efflux RND transporter permease subunit [Leptospira congkakensis]TGL87869.1 efflux RND transporter permease subunit [Leptospira congkakensis]TGL92646.1 efflux RND transporter permease subunit [Leptospira congkakensis]TGL96019.1 efflux RND transporter permease subunit [Leptospira congkakensis]
MKIESYVLSLSKHRRLYWVISFSLFVAIFFRISELEIWLLPKLTPVRYFVDTEFPNHSAEDTDLMVSLPISEILSSVKSVERIRSIAEHGKSIIQMDLLYGASISEFKEELYQTIFEMKDKLPPGVGVSRLFQGAKEERPFMEILISKPNEKEKERFEFQLKQLRFHLERISGVAEVRMSGTPTLSTFVSINSNVFDLFPIGIRDLESQILSGMRGGSLGKIEGYHKDTELKFSNEIKSKEDLSEFQIYLGNGSSVSLNRFAKVFDSELPEEKLTRINGKEVVYLAIHSDSNANPIRVSSEIQKKLNSFSMIDSEIYFDVSSELRTGLTQFGFNLIWGLVFAFLFSYLLYRSLSPSLVLFVSVFFSLVLFFHLILLFSISINLLSLGGISVGVGMLFDASNLSVFSIRKQLEIQSSIIVAVTKGIQSILVSLFSSSLTTIVVFIPLLVFPMEWKEFLFDSGVCIALLVFCSLVSSLWIVPLVFISLPNFQKIENNLLLQENLFFRWYDHSYKLRKIVNLRIFSIGFVCFLIVCVFSFGANLEIFPKQASVGIRILTSPKNRVSLKEELNFVNDLEFRIKKFDPKISILVLPLELNNDGNQHPTKAISIQWKLFGVERPKELEIFVSKILSKSSWDWKWESLESEVTKALPFLPTDSIVFLHENWETLRSFSYEWMNASIESKLNGVFSFFPNQIVLEEWSRRSIPIPELIPDEDDLKHRILYKQRPEYLGKIGEEKKGSLYLGVEIFDSNFQTYLDSEGTRFKTKTNDLTYSGSLFANKSKTSYDEFRRESGLFYLEWIGDVSHFEDKSLAENGISFIKLIAAEEIRKFFITLLLLFFIAFAFIYLALVGIYESFTIPLFYLGISIFYLLITTSVVFILFDTFHLGHYIGLVVLLGLSLDNISLFGERWAEIRQHVHIEKAREKVFRWLVWPISLNSGTTMMGFLPVLFFGFSGSEFSKSIALTMFIGIPISIFLVFYIYPIFFQKFYQK